MDAMGGSQHPPLAYQRAAAGDSLAQEGLFNDGGLTREKICLSKPVHVYLSPKIFGQNRGEKFKISQKMLPLIIVHKIQTQSLYLEMVKFSYLPRMLTEESTVATHNTRLSVLPTAPTSSPCVNFSTFGIGNGPKVRVNSVNLVAIHATRPNKATVAQIQRLFALNSATNTQSAFIFFASVPTIVRHQIEAFGSRIHSGSRAAQ